MAHKHSVYDTDAHLTIVPTSRKIIGAERIKLVRGDHNSSRVTFDIPRFVDGHDMAETSIVEIHYINISADGKNTNEDVYPADDVQISPESDDVVIFSWLISNNATKYAGTLSFMLCFKCVTGEVLDYSWRTDTAKGVHVLKSLDCTPSAVEDVTDILTVWEMKIADLMGRVESMEDAMDGKLDKVTTTSEAQRAYIVTQEGNQELKRIVFGSAEAHSIAARDAEGSVAVGTPTNETHAVPLGFADGRYVPIVIPGAGEHVYTVNSKGTHRTFSLGYNDAAWTIAVRDEGGVLKVGAPIHVKDAVPLGFADGRYVPLLESLAGEHGAYIRTREGGHQLLPIGYGATTPYTLVARTDNGVVRVGEPRAYNDATTKKFVENAIASAGGTTTEVYWSEVDGGEYIVTDGEYAFGFEFEGSTPSNGQIRYNGVFDRVVWRGGNHDFITVSGNEDGWFENGVILKFSDAVKGETIILKFRELPCLVGSVNLRIEVI